jgi:hypothetical protein
MLLSVDMEIEAMNTAVKQCIQALVNCGVTGCFINIEWVRLNIVYTWPLMSPILVYNVNSTANEVGVITQIADLVLCHDSHSEHTQFSVTHLGKQSIILGYNWLCNHNLEINWQTKEVKSSTC